MLGEEYTYPDWSTAVGWILTMSSILCIPAYIIYKFIRTPGGVIHVRINQDFYLSKPNLLNKISFFMFSVSERYLIQNELCPRLYQAKLLVEVVLRCDPIMDK